MAEEENTRAEFERAMGKTENPKMFNLGDVEFVDAEFMAKEHPDTFETPEEEVLSALVVGDVVKVCDGAERFWTVIKEIDFEGTITAEVNNTLVGEQPYNYGDVVQFERRHIYEVHSKQDTELMGATVAYFMHLEQGRLNIIQAYKLVESMTQDGVPLSFIHALAKAAVEDTDTAENQPPENGDNSDE